MSQAWTAAELIDDTEGNYDCDATGQDAEGGFECCRPAGHRGPHIAQALNAVAAVSIIAVWEAS